MSLQVWLPLNGDSKNYGLANLPNPVVNTLTYENGKIGQCGTGRVAWHLNEDILNNAWSVAVWVKSSSAYSSNNNIIFCKNTSASTDCQIYFSIVNGTSFHVGVNGPASSISQSFTFTLDVWNHLAATYDGNTVAIYINGELKKTAIVTTAFPTGRMNLTLNGRSTNDAGTGVTGQLNGYRFNDFRLYNHALSAKEVQEIAKGLILHYKLDGPGENLLRSNPKSHGATSYNAYQFNIVENLIVGETYTLQLWNIDVYHSAKTAAQTGVWIYWGGGSVHLFNWAGPTYFTQTSATNYHADYLVKTFTITSNNASGSGATNAWLNVYNSVSNADGTRNMSIGAWKLEKGSGATAYTISATDGNLDNKIWDASGYNHHAVPVGAIAVSSDSPRYNASTEFVNDSYIRSEERPAMILPTDAITVNFWQKSTTWSQPISCTEGGGWNIENASSIRFPVYIAGTGYVIATSGVAASTLNGSWHMITGTYNRENVKIYIDGELKATAAVATPANIQYANNYLFIAAEAGGNTTTAASSSYVGNISDVRVYATALSAAAIKELYDTSATIDNNGNIYAREVVEV